VVGAAVFLLRSGGVLVLAPAAMLGQRQAAALGQVDERLQGHARWAVDRTVLDQVRQGHLEVPTIHARTDRQRRRPTRHENQVSVINAAWTNWSRTADCTGSCMDSGRVGDRLRSLIS
jgi:hypothetical protein